MIGAVVLGAVVLGAVVLGAVVLGAVVLGTVVLGTVVLGSVVLGAVVLGEVVLGEVVLGSVVLGSVVLTTVVVAAVVVCTVVLTTVVLGLSSVEVSQDAKIDALNIRQSVIIKIFTAFFILGSPESDFFFILSRFFAFVKEARAFLLQRQKRPYAARKVFFYILFKSYLIKERFCCLHLVRRNTTAYLKLAHRVFKPSAENYLKPAAHVIYRK